jgi:protein TonB
MAAELPQSSSKLTPILALLGAIVMAGGLFLMIPLTQTLEAQPQKILEYREVPVAAPPPPKAPPPSTRSEATLQQAAEKPQLEQSKPQMQLSQLEISLNPGMGASLSMGVQGMQFDTAIDVVAEIERIFEFEELQERPRPVYRPQPKFPPDLARRGVREIRATVEIIIDETGKTTVEKVDSVSPNLPAVEDEARRFASRLRFSVTKIDGAPVKVRARFPWVLKSR